MHRIHCDPLGRLILELWTEAEGKKHLRFRQGKQPRFCSRGLHMPPSDSCHTSPAASPQPPRFPRPEPQAQGASRRRFQRVPPESQVGGRLSLQWRCLRPRKTLSWVTRVDVIARVSLADYNTLSAAYHPPYAFFFFSEEFLSAGGCGVSVRTRHYWPSNGSNLRGPSGVPCSCSLTAPDMCMHFLPLHVAGTLSHNTIRPLFAASQHSL